MRIVSVRRLAAAACLSFTITSCGGGSQHATPSAPAAAVSNGRTVLSNSPGCSIPLIVFANTTSSTTTVNISPLKVHAPCDISGQLFGATAFQSAPLPPIVKPGVNVLKLGDATGQGHNVTFTPALQTLTLQPNTTWSIAVLAEPNDVPDPTAYIAFPLAAGPYTTVLRTGTKPDGTSRTSLAFSYATATTTGISVYEASCFDATPGIDPVGTPSFYCHFNPGSSSFTFSGTQNDPTVKFYIGDPRYDASVLGLDGPLNNYLCNAETIPAECNAASFTVSNTAANAITNVIVGNANDLRICVPVTDNTDCNNGAPARTTVSSSRSFQVLIADDPTYNPQSGAAPNAGWDGMFHGLDTTVNPPKPTANPTVSGSCHITTSADNNNPKAPPGYTDNGQQAVGPLAEIDVTPNSTGTCTIIATEDPVHRFITNLLNPNSATGRSFTLTVTIGQ